MKKNSMNRVRIFMQSKIWNCIEKQVCLFSTIKMFNVIFLSGISNDYFIVSATFEFFRKKSKSTLSYKIKHPLKRSLKF